MISQDLKDKYNAIVREAFYDDLGRSIILYFSQPEITPSVANPTNIYGNNNFDFFGNPTKILDIGDRNLESASGYTQVYSTGIVTARVYWQRDIKVDNHTNLNNKICKINFKIEDMSKVNQANYISVEDENNVFVKLNAIKTRDSLPYGLGSSKEVITFWKTF